MANAQILTFPDDALLTVMEVKAYLRVNKDEAYALVNSGAIPSLRIGRQHRVPFWSLKAWVARQAGVEPPPLKSNAASQH